MTWPYMILNLCVQNLLIERLGRRLMLMGGYVLMTGWAVVFTVALSLEVCIIQCCITPLSLYQRTYTVTWNVMYKLMSNPKVIMSNFNFIAIQSVQLCLTMSFTSGFTFHPIEYGYLDALPEHDLHLHLHSQLWHGTR